MSREEEVRREGEMRKRRERRFCPRSNSEIPVQLVDLHGAGDDGAGTQSLQRQHAPQSRRLQGEQQSEDCCFLQRNRTAAAAVTAADSAG